MCLGRQHSHGESSKSFSAFFTMHEGHYDRIYHKYNFDRWLAWHRFLDFSARHVVRQEAVAAPAHDRPLYSRRIHPVFTLDLSLNLRLSFEQLPIILETIALYPGPRLPRSNLSSHRR
ncbi:hypothetical protein BS47DRAFT_401981 [Hydnum rufescens UP504]|uniref:Uncharacterized protein n=1 Tax=Hydnum rufescens UP504 TaxID=1448309 RepID=A0A9P6BBD4_9AGAM|nr:hypothetical protein BS47DRAFT_401981 [Hydnum rufescens UP504]